VGRYTVYRAGEAEPVRVAADSPGQADASPAPVIAPLGRSDRSRRRWLVWPALAVALAAGAVLFWLYGREATANTLAAVDIAKLSGKVPSWSLVAAPAVAALVTLLVAVYLAFGRRLALKVFFVALLAAALAAPGLAVGWANGTVGSVSSKAPGVAAAVSKAKKELRPELPGKPMNILLIGSDTRGATDPGRSDTQLLVRLDPATKSISMLSLPRDLRIDIPGVGLDKMNAAYSYGGAALAVKTFSQVTGLPINHYIEINFAGFWHAINILGGVYFPVDHSYYVTNSPGYGSPDLQAGYQLLHGRQALKFVRFRHDQQGDFTRMQRQQLFLKEVQRQSGRWSHDWPRVIRLIKAITAQTTSDIDSLRRLKPLVELAFVVNTAKINQVHVEGSTPMIDGISYVEATPEEIAAAVQEFVDPTAPPVKSARSSITKAMFTVRVYNGTQTTGLATSTAVQLKALGYHIATVADAPEYSGQSNVIYAPQELESRARELAALLPPCEVQLHPRAPGTLDGISVVLGPAFAGTVVTPTVQATPEPQQTVQKNVRYDQAGWRTLDAQTPIALRMPTVWSPALGYDEFRAYRITTPDGRKAPAVVVVGTTPQGGYWSVQAMRWLNPPAISDPTATRRVGGKRYMLFYQGEHLHMVAWKGSSTLYWVLNTLDNQLSDDFMMSLATSFKPVK
jgi:LCP family protein required for cell wall assembly